MKNKFRFTSLVLCLAIACSVAVPVYATSSDYDSVEEKLKHETTTANFITEKSTAEVYITENNQESSEYRLADEKAATLLKNTVENSRNSDNAQHYYDITISFEKNDRIEAMYKMLTLHSSVDAETQAAFKGYVLSYAPYAGDETLLQHANETVNNQNDASLFATYSASDAATWAYNNFNKYSSNFPKLTNLEGRTADCANFVSQAMHVDGGMPMSNDWYCYRKNTVYPAPTTVAELDYSWTLSDPSPWISAKKFKDFWSVSTRSTIYEYDLGEYKDGTTDAFSKPIYKGHAITLLNAVAWWYEGAHTMIVIDYDTANSDYIFAAHSNETRTATVKNVGDYDRVIFYAFK